MQAEQQVGTTIEACCRLCQLPLPLVCWRAKIQSSLLSLKLKPKVKQHPYATVKVDPNPFWIFYCIDGWKDSLSQFVATSNYLMDKQWQLRYIEFQEQKTQINEIFRASEHERLLTNDKEVVNQKLQKDAQGERETGQSVLKLQNSFHQKVLFIKDQVSFQKHPWR